jgi:hypothetical protein
MLGVPHKKTSHNIETNEGAEGSGIRKVIKKGIQFNSRVAAAQHCRKEWW